MKLKFMSMTSPAKFYHMTRIILWMRSCDQSLITLREGIITSNIWTFDQKYKFFERCSWLKFTNLGLTQGMAKKFYINVAKRLKLKVRNFKGLILTFVKVTGENWLVGRERGCFLPSPPSWKGLIFLFVYL